MKLKRTLIILLCLVFTISVFTACGSRQSSSGGTKGSSTSKGNQSDRITEIKLPIVKEPLTLTYWTGMDPKMAATMKDYGEMKCYQELEKRTGIHIKFLHPPMGQERDQFNLMMASNDLPDIIYYSWWSIPGGPGKALSDGSIIKLNDLIDKYAPNFKKLLEENPDIKKQAELDDGTIFCFPFIRSAGALINANWGPQLRKDWLDKLGLQLPKTIEDWHNVLVTFRDRDPNGNGKKDEIPFTGRGSNGQGILDLGNFAPAWGILNGFYMDNGKINYGPIQSAYKNFLKTMAQWYKEKLIDQDIATNDNKAFDYKITNNLAGSYFGLVAGNMGRYLNLMKPKEPNFDLVGAPWPIGPAGKSYTTTNLNLKVMNVGAAISSKNKHIKETVEWLDYAYSPEGHMLLNFGIEGQSYNMENGYPKYTDIIFKNPNGLSYDQALAQWAPSISSAPMDQDKRYYEQILQLPEQKEAAFKTWLDADPSLTLPLITPTEEESQRLASIMNQVNTYQQEMMGKFIMGKEPINDSTWNKYVNTIKGMGIDEAIKIENAALQRYNNRP
ncbi:putative aldouronate transport system substrate-binding protein [Caldanaerobius fijiensis DSM 17918]|uniref:Putative aldouronate transport system substrate-binding protein n=1 Tax=Caldanaerobius fijiensis DSM 17918 TaxID=1121256 RepID=A0A1M5CS08_9THEO|nr:extracellular solute-binding protein [Caldanaerobius fijiensis]SHF57521.1 putative aldouronate transport system substrate-binding protein [Caldanaerobius fijiensis DSM 17918]